MPLTMERTRGGEIGWFWSRPLMDPIQAMAIFHQLSRRRAQDAALKVAGGMTPWINADDNGAVETSPFSTSPNSWPISEAAASNAATQ
jgi:hypothetical protein